MGKSYRDKQPSYESNLQAKTPTQSAYLSALDNQMTTIAIGPPGTGKTYMAAIKAYEGLMKNQYKKLILSRPAKGTEDDIGFEPGTMNEKMAGWVRPLSEPLMEVMGKGQYQDRVGNTIELVPLHQMMGRSFSNSFIIIDEAHNMSEATAMSIVTRVGKYSKLVICGDIGQKTIDYGSGLCLLLDLIDRHHLPVNIISFTMEDCVRSKDCKMWIEAFDREGLI